LAIPRQQAGTRARDDQPGLYRAAVELSAGLNAAEEVGAVAWTFIGRRYLGLLALLRNDLSEAERLLTSAFLNGRDRQAGEELAYALDDFAALAAAKDDPATAATLWGAADAQLEALGLGILEAGRQNRERFMPLARRVLGESSWTIYRERGYGMAADEAAAHAVAQQGATPEGP
jgi:hypothetical protein